LIHGYQIAFEPRVTIQPVSSLFPSVFQPNSTLSNTSSSSSPVSTAAQQTDASGLSPTASFLSELQQLQVQSPTQFNQLVSSISNNLTQAAQTAASSGNSTKASQLNALATQFQNSTNGGQIPTPQDLQQAGLSGHHHHHGGHHSSGQPSSTNPFQLQSSAGNTPDLLDSLLGTSTSTQPS
jgi:hypothetical protein